MRKNIIRMALAKGIYKKTSICFKNTCYLILQKSRIESERKAIL